jgi:hypothetical protein
MVFVVAESRLRPFYRAKKARPNVREVEAVEPSRPDEAIDPKAPGPKTRRKKDDKVGRKLDISL